MIGGYERNDKGTKFKNALKLPEALEPVRIDTKVMHNIARL